MHAKHNLASVSIITLWHTRRVKTKDSDSDFWKRLVAEMSANGYDTKTQADVGKFVGVNQTSARKWKIGETLPDIKNLVFICEKLDVSFEWLLTGRGPKRPVTSDFYERLSTMMSDPEARVLHVGDTLTDEQNETLTEVARVVDEVRRKVGYDSVDPDFVSQLIGVFFEQAIGTGRINVRGLEGLMRQGPRPR